jgi:hypothetical protein
VPSRPSLVLMMVALSATSWAGVTLDTSATASVSDRALMRLEVANVGDAPADDVTPEVVYQGREVRGEPLAELRPGDRHTWSFDLPRPAEPGALPAVFHVMYTDPARHRASVPAVAAVVTPGLLPVPEVRATLTASPVTRFGRGVVALENPTSEPIYGRLVMVLPAGLTTEPESQAAGVAAQGRSEVPIVVQNEGARPGSSAPVFALFDYALDGRRHLSVAPAVVTVSAEHAAVSSLLVGAAALGLALALLTVAWRGAARRVARARDRAAAGDRDT